MLVGSGDPERLGASAARVPVLEGPGLVCEDAAWLTALCEIRNEGVLGLLPPALHPTNPPFLRLVATRVAGSELGAFTLAELRLECRSGARPRALCLAAWVEAPDADATAAALRARFGFPARSAAVELRTGYYAWDARVTTEAGTVLGFGARELEPLGAGDVQNVSSLHWAHTERGLRLLQVEIEPEALTTRRGSPVGIELGAADVGVALEPTFPVAATVQEGTLRLPPLRFLCRPDQLAFSGTERV